ncbi:MAG: hypothetical protein U9R38_03855 [Candidatus Margulisiibacteriota bacterium]|nr:hypothetical protein [Candidatus Margulisiibacteriota bacterium]
MAGAKIPPGGLGFKGRVGAQKQTALQQRTAVQLQIRTLECLRNNRIAELKGILTGFVKNNKLGNLARNFDEIICEGLNPIHSLRKFVDLLRDVMGSDFYRLFIEFSGEAQAKIIGQIKVGNEGVRVAANLLYRLLLVPERGWADKKTLQAAAQLASPEILYHLLNNYEIAEDSEGKLSLVYLVKYRKSDEIGPLISQALGDYIKCGPQVTLKETKALQSFRRIMEGFRDFSIQAQLV